jgi:circadian clock protein KaiC
MEENKDLNIVPTGIFGLDQALRGGLRTGKMYLLSGAPGTGKSTFSLQFIAEGIKRSERCLYIAVTGGVEDLADMAKSAGIFLDPDYLAPTRSR